MMCRVQPAPTFHSYLTLTARAILPLLLLASACAQEPTSSPYVSFDAPNVLGTTPAATNCNGWIGGSLFTVYHLQHGFLHHVPRLREAGFGGRTR